MRQGLFLVWLFCAPLVGFAEHAPLTTEFPPGCGWVRFVMGQDTAGAFQNSSGDNIFYVVGDAGPVFELFLPAGEYVWFKEGQTNSPFYVSSNTCYQVISLYDGGISVVVLPSPDEPVGDWFFKGCFVGAGIILICMVMKGLKSAIGGAYEEL